MVDGNTLNFPQNTKLIIIIITKLKFPHNKVEDHRNNEILEIHVNVLAQAK